MDILSEKLKSLGNVDVERRSLSHMTGFKTGGDATVVVPKTVDALCEIVRILREAQQKFYVLGNGSNVLALDDGYDGFVVSMGDLCEITVCGNILTALAGASLGSVCRAAADYSLTGLEFAYGIPGTVGGAVFMNAGAYGGEIKDVFVRCKVLNENNEIETITAEQAELTYRSSVFHKNRNLLILSAVFELKTGVHDSIKAKMDELMKARLDKQPLAYPSCGSTFKRPVGNYAAKLIDECGLRGFTIGGAQVSEKHCGFVINKRDATSEDILAVIDHVQKTVFENTGYLLEREIEILE